jgi:hypothetical protein
MESEVRSLKVSAFVSLELVTATIVQRHTVPEFVIARDLNCGRRKRTKC